MSNTAQAEATHASPQQRELPSGWRLVRLGVILSALESGSRPKGGAVGVESGVPSISAEQMTIHGNFNFAIKRFVPREFYEQMTRGHIQQGDILIVKDGATTGKTCFIDETFPFREAVVNEHVFICRTNQDQIQSLFLFYWLWGPQGQYEIKSSFQGAAIGGINQGFVDSVSIPLPSLPEQRRIVAVLREQIAGVEKARTAAQSRLEAVKALPAAFLRQVFPQPGQPLPAGWRWAKLGEMCDRIDYGYTASADVDVKTPKFLRITDIQNNKVNWDSVPGCAILDADEDANRLEDGDIVFARTGATTGKSYLISNPPRSVFASYLIRVKSHREHVEPDYLFAFFQSDGYWKQISAGARGGAQPGFNATMLAALKIPLPPLSEQRQIATVLHEQMASLEKIRLAVEEELATIDTLPSALLRRAFNGEL